MPPAPQMAVEGGGNAVRRWVLIALAVAVLVAVWALAAEIQRAQGRLATLPARVADQLRRHGDAEVPLGQMSRYLPLATVAVEDRSFWTNPGVSLEGIARAALVDVASEAWVEGASTITQQLIRDQLLGYQKTLHRKLTEMLYAILCTRRFSKREILTLYLNEANYGHGAFGVGAASMTYFGLPPADLSLAQSALLAGLPQDPAGLDPFLHPEAARERRAVVVAAMVAVGDLSQRAAAQLDRAPLGLLPAARAG